MWFSMSAVCTPYSAVDQNWYQWSAFCHKHYECIATAQRNGESRPKPHLFCQLEHGENVVPSHCVELWLSNLSKMNMFWRVLMPIILSCSKSCVSHFLISATVWFCIWRCIRIKTIVVERLTVPSQARFRWFVQVWAIQNIYARPPVVLRVTAFNAASGINLKAGKVMKLMTSPLLTAWYSTDVPLSLLCQVSMSSNSK